MIITILYRLQNNKQHRNKILMRIILSKHRNPPINKSLKIVIKKANLNNLMSKIKKILRIS